MMHLKARYREAARDQGEQESNDFMGIGVGRTRPKENKIITCIAQ